jgi:hypothetical protein
VATVQQRTASVAARVSSPKRHDNGRADLLAPFAAAMAQVERAAALDLDPAIQKELGLAVAVLHQAWQQRRLELLLVMEASISGLAKPNPNLVLAEETRQFVSRRLRRGYRLVPLSLGLACGVLAFAVAYGWIFLFQGPHEGFLGFDKATQNNIAMVTLTGALGAAVSLMLRVRNLGRYRSIDSEALFYTAFFKPIVGAAFALFSFLALNAGIINLASPPEKQRFLFAALAFVAGFSERFAKDVIDKVAGAADDDHDDDIEVLATSRKTTVTTSDDGDVGAAEDGGTNGEIAVRSPGRQPPPS